MRKANDTFFFFLKNAAMTMVLMAVSLQTTAQNITSRYDVNRDGDVTVTDVIYLVNYILGMEVSEEPQLILSATNVTVAIGDTASVIISGGSSKYLSYSNDASVAYPVVKDSTLFIIPVSIGCTEVTVRDAQGVCDYNINVIVTGVAPASVVAVDLGLPSGLKWANYNIGASQPEEYGSYYAWGEVKEKNIYDWKSYIHCDSTMYSIHNIGGDISGTQFDAARMNWGNSWRMPTHDEMQELIENCSWIWTSINGVYGRQGTGPSGETIFFPAAGCHVGDATYSLGSYGNYWSASCVTSTSFDSGLPLGTANAYYLNVSKYYIYIDTYYLNDGYSIRAVSE